MAFGWSEVSNFRSRMAGKKPDKSADLSVPEMDTATGMAEVAPLNERRENGFEAAKRELESFLNVRFIEHAGDGNLEVVLKELEKKMDAVAVSEPREVSIQYLAGLIMNDEMDGSNMPEIFKVTWEEYKQIFDDGYLDDGVDGFEGERDVVAVVSSLDDEREDFRTYRTYLYECVVNALSKLGNSAEDSILKVLKEMRKIRVVDSISVPSFRRRVKVASGLLKDRTLAEIVDLTEAEREFNGREVTKSDSELKEDHYKKGIFPRDMQYQNKMLLHLLETF